MHARVARRRPAPGRPCVLGVDGYREFRLEVIGLALIAKARGEAEAVACWAADARAYALEVGDPVSLLRRETEVLELLARRLSRKEIAERLGLSPDTVKTYTRTLYEKLGVNRRRDAVARALTAGLIPPPS